MYNQASFGQQHRGVRPNNNAGDDSFSLKLEDPNVVYIVAHPQHDHDADGTTAKAAA